MLGSCVILDLSPQLPSTHHQLWIGKQRPYIPRLRVPCQTNNRSLNRLPSLGTRNLDLLLSSPTSKGSPNIKRQTIHGFIFGGLWEWKRRRKKDRQGKERKIWKRLLAHIFLLLSLSLFPPHCPFNIWEERLSGKGPKY